MQRVLAPGSKELSGFRSALKCAPRWFTFLANSLFTKVLEGNDQAIFACGRIRSRARAAKVENVRRSPFGFALSGFDEAKFASACLRCIKLHPVHDGPSQIERLSLDRQHDEQRDEQGSEAVHGATPVAAGVRLFLRQAAVCAATVFVALCEASALETSLIIVFAPGSSSPAHASALPCRAHVGCNSRRAQRTKRSAENDEVGGNKFVTHDVHPSVDE